MLNKKASIIFVFITVLIDAIGIGLVSPILPDVIRKFNSDENFVTTYFGYFISVYSLMLFIASPLLGALSDKFGRRPILLMALCGAGLDYLLMAFAPNLTLLFVGRILAGLCGASITVAMSYIADISNDKNRTNNFGLVGAAFGLGFIIGPAIGGLVGSYGHHWPFIIAAIMSLSNFLFGIFILPESHAKEKRVKEISFKKINPLISLFNIFLRVPNKILIWAYFLLQLAFQSHGSIWTLYAHEKFKWDTLQIGLSLTLVGLALTVGQALTTRLLVPKIGERNAMFFGMTFLTINFFIFALSSTKLGVYIGIFLIVITCICTPTMQSVITKESSPNEQGKLQGSLVSIVSLCAIIGPILYTSVFKEFTHKSIYFPGAPYIIAAFLTIASIILVKLSQKKN